ncbi:Putative Zinc finger, RING-type, SPX domain, Zinc finger, RING/FYVE/PHD-type [Colletotrichum destructivum]|uniref:Zinc finger, RING-type, SPX domain, Zinc finger, RING/FYVE/PHD-type n=1 Tax=Colletotrichum destructivum TaxID=34406 RepID=A0AAX4IPW7_9PEZI|nr:Putative Zinc finger, RING-type, SPX domain, Zinc finger, RING/FYVE/PHD-type [Colletotrichum destructivum]
MKFAHDFKETLRREDFPSHWIDLAIPYGQLKKVLKRVARELNDLGLDPETLRQLLDPADDSPLAAKYRLNAAGNSKLLRPKLTVLVHMRDGNAVDASLAPASRNLIERIAALQSHDPDEGFLAPLKEPGSTSVLISSAESLANAEIELSDTQSGDEDHGHAAPVEHFERIEVPLVFDSEFFGILQSDVNNLDALQAKEEKAMVTEIVALRQEVSHLTKPSRLSKSDLARWRAIFELYLDAQVFFSTNEQDHGSRSSQTAAKQLQWFQEEITKRNLVKSFKIAESREALVRFLRLNAVLLKNLQFQEINQVAIYKILKKFDKRTCLGVSKSFPVQVHSDKLLAGSVAKDICAQMSTDLVSVVPQISDYLCPICFAIAYRPVRLACRHVFCIRCIVKIQRRNEKHCPLCRADTVMKASADNLDIQLERYMRKYFPKEAKEKQRANEIERGIEDYGPEYVHSECSVM